MASARRLYRVTLGLGAAAGAAALVAAGAGASAVEVSMPSSAELAAACRRFVPMDLGVAGAIALAALAIGTLVLALFGRSLAREVAATRRYLRGLGVVRRDRVGETDVEVFSGTGADAFCAGYLRPRIYLSSGLFERLGQGELDAVVAHERHHRIRRDPLRLVVARALADALFFVPALRRLGDRYAALAELAADEAAIRVKGSATLASALLSLSPVKGGAVVVGMGPERVDHLLGDARARWELPVSLLLTAALAVAGLISVAGLAAATAGGASLHLVILMVQSCMLLMAAVATALGAFLLHRLQRPFRRAD